MEKHSPMTRAQTIFLRACTKDPWGLTSKDWPNAVTFRRWMRRRTFRKAIKEVRDALRFQADLHLAAASAAAAQALNQSLTAAGEQDIAKLSSQKEQIQYLTTLLKLSHVRERFSRDYETPEPEPVQAHSKERRYMIQYLRDMENPGATCNWLLGVLQRAEARAEAERRDNTKAA